MTHHNLTIKMKIFTAEQLHNIEQQTLDEDKITLLNLIENSSETIAAEITSRWLNSKKIVAFAGWGNNGADTLATVRQLAMQDYRIDVYHFNIGNQLTPECRVCRDELLKVCSDKVRLYEINGKESFSWPEVNSDDLVIDGLFGTGLTDALPVPFQLIVRNINYSGATIVSIDLPSGMMPEWNTATSTEQMIHADLTLALGTPHLAFMFAESAEAVGEWKVLDTGLSINAMRKSPYQYFLVEKSSVQPFLTPRKEFASKADFGHALLCAGSEGMMGAAVLATKGALRAGAGKVTLHSSRSGINIAQITVPDAMFDADANGRCITNIPSSTEKYTALGMGPGIGTSDATVDALEHMLKARFALNKPVVLDADALNCMAKKPALMNCLPVLSVLPPHPGEFDRMFGEQTSTCARLQKAIQVAHFHRVIIVLKGHFTAVVRPDGKVFFNSSGTPAMATGGSGDVLTGVLTGLMAQGFKPEKATIIGCYVHGVAGEIAAAAHGDYGTTASDIAENIGRAIVSIQE